MKACRRLAAAMMLGVAALAAGPAHADEQEDPATVETARSLFSDGSAHFHAGRWAAALAAFQRSHALVASPNTMLMMARSLRELGRPVDAAEAFDAAKADAARKVAAGEAKYAPTERAAAEEGRKVRAGLGQIRIRVAQPEGASLHVDGAPVTLDGAGTASLLHPPGNASVVVTDARGGEQRQAVTVLAGSTVEMAFAGDAPPRSTTTLPPSPAPPPERPAPPGSCRPRSRPACSRSPAPASSSASARARTRPTRASPRAAVLGPAGPPSAPRRMRASGSRRSPTSGSPSQGPRRSRPSPSSSSR